VSATSLDPLALRLVFMHRRYRDELDLTWEILAGADQALTGWRRSVAQWANSPSGAMPVRYSGAITAAFEDDLAAPAALGELQTLADDGDVAPGAKFETFAAADRLLGLDLARDVGRY
jgi:cysteinyl-tRNA synthetase